MKTMKKLALYLLIPALLTACGTRHPYDNPDELGVIYEGENQRVVQVKRLTPEEIATSPSYGASASYLPFIEEGLYCDPYNDFAAVGKISNIREIREEYKENGEHKVDYATLFNMTTERVYYIKDIDHRIDLGDTITVYTTHSSYGIYSDMDPALVEGDTYMIFGCLASTVMEGKWIYDLTAISDYAVISPMYHFIRKNGGYYEVPHWLDRELKEYDSERISKADAFGINDDNYVAAGYHLGVEWVRVHNVNGSEYQGAFEPREAVLKSPVYAELYLEYMEENSESVFNFEDEAPQDHNWIDYIDDIPQNLKDMLFEKALATYTFPDKLEGEYDYKLGLSLEYPDGFDELNAFQGISDSVYLYRAEAFENTILHRISEYRTLGDEIFRQREDDKLRDRGIIE
ncbi:MAG: hypothetical protein FWH04_09235 [Oscillospiraceae bacterium]|nr:hypothetical protein [Oscillospiraceae bacterium]